MTSNKQKGEADKLAQKKEFVVKQKAAHEKRKKKKEIAKEKAVMKARAAKDQKKLAKAASASAAKKKKEEGRKQAAERAETKRQQDKKRVTATKILGHNYLAVSPRFRSGKRGSASTTSSVTSVVTQGEHNRAKIDDPPDIKKKLSSNFETAIGLEEQPESDVTVDSVTKRAYKPKDLERSSDTGWSIVDDAKFVTESVDMDFSKDNVKRDPMVLL